MLGCLLNKKRKKNKKRREARLMKKNVQAQCNENKHPGVEDKILATGVETDISPSTADETADWLQRNDSYAQEFSWSIDVLGSVLVVRVIIMQMCWTFVWGSCCNYIGFICWSFCAHAEGYQGTDTTLGDMTVNTTSASHILDVYQGTIDNMGEDDSIPSKDPRTGETHRVCPKERRRERARAQREAMTAEKRELINKCRRDAYHAKKANRPHLSAEQNKKANRPHLSAEQKKANVKGSKREYKRRLKEFRANNLHPDSIAMANPQFVPKLIIPTPIELLTSASELVIPEFSGSPVYTPPIVEQTPDDQGMESGVGRCLPSRRVVAVERNALRNQRNKEFHATIGKNRSSTYDTDKCGDQLSTESCEEEQHGHQDHMERVKTQEHEEIDIGGSAPKASSWMASQSQPICTNRDGKKTILISYTHDH